MTELVIVGKRKRELTDRMLEVIELGRQGLRNGEIADKLGVSKTAIDVMKTKINRRLKTNGIFQDLNYNR